MVFHKKLDEGYNVYLHGETTGNLQQSKNYRLKK